MLCAGPERPFGKHATRLAMLGMGRRRRVEAREPKASIAGAFLELLVVANRRQSLPFLFHSKGVVIVLLTSSSSFFVICVTIILVLH